MSGVNFTVVENNKDISHYTVFKSNVYTLVSCKYDDDNGAEDRLNYERSSTHNFASMDEVKKHLFAELFLEKNNKLEFLLTKDNKKYLTFEKHSDCYISSDQLEQCVNMFLEMFNNSDNKL